MKFRVASTMAIPAWVLGRKVPFIAVPMSTYAEILNEFLMLNVVVESR